MTINLKAQIGSTCDNPIVATLGTNTFTGNQSVDQWYNYTTNRTGKITISSCTLTSEDTKIAVYQGGFCVPLILKSDNDDHCSLQSKVSFIGTAGYDYFIVWQNKSSSNTFDWTIEESDWEQGESCDNPIVAVGGESNVSNHSGATDQWFSFVAPGDGKITISTCGLTSENTSVRVYDACSGIQLAGNDDYCSTQSEVEFDCLQGINYLFQWEVGSISSHYNWSLIFNSIPTSVIEEAEAIKIDLDAQQGVIRVDLPDETPSIIKIVNLAGQIVKTTSVKPSQMEVNVRDLKKGVYIIIIESKSDLITKKISWR